MLGALARSARPLALAAALLWLSGVALTGLNLLLVGWSVYAIGHVAAALALLAVGAEGRRRMDAWAWLGLLVLVVGLVLGLPQVAVIWQSYAADGVLLPVAARDMELPVWTAPLGLTAELVTWVGLVFFGLAARGSHALPAGIAWVWLGAAVVGFVAALYLVSPYAWVVAVVLFALGLLGTGVALRPRLAAGSEGP